MIKTSLKPLFVMFIAVTTIALVQVRCGEKSESASITFKPEDNPIAVDAPLTIGSGDNEKTIEKPWYLFRYQIKHGSDQTLYLVSFKFIVSGTKNGITTTKTYSIDPGEFCAEGYSRPFLGIVTPGLNFTGNDLDSSTDPFSRCGLPPTNPTPLASGFEGWYLSGLPPSDNLIYSIQIQGEGWFEKTSGEISERAYINGFQVTR